jgi:hypothetical protein
MGRSLSISAADSDWWTVSEVRHKVHRQRCWHAWVGTLDEFKRIGSITEKLFSERRLVLIETKRKELSERREASTQSSVSDTQLALNATMDQGELDRFSNSLYFETTIESGPDSSTGELEATFAEFDRRTVTGVTFNGRFSYEVGDELLRVVVSWGDLRQAIRVDVVSADHGWANKALASLSEEIDKGRVRWSWVHLVWGRTLVAAAINAALIVALFLIIERFWISAYAIVVAGGIALLISTMTIVPDKSFYKIFPMTEILASTGESTGRRRWGLLGSIFLMITAGIIVNILV